jgi:hypothetical protein
VNRSGNADRPGGEERDNAEESQGMALISLTVSPPSRWPAPPSILVGTDCAATVALRQRSSTRRRRTIDAGRVATHPVDFNNGLAPVTMTAGSAFDSGAIRSSTALAGC